MHGSEAPYASGYDDAALDRWAARIKTWAAGGQASDARLVDPNTARRRASRDVYVYFDYDAKVLAPIDAQALRARLAGC